MTVKLLTVGVEGPPTAGCNACEPNFTRRNSPKIKELGHVMTLIFYEWMCSID